jgi:hypothetical protein
MSEDVRMPSFAEVAEHRADGRVVQLPEDIDALQLLQMEYRGEIELTYAQRRAAEACLPFERPKLGVMATTTMNADDFASMLDRCIARSQVRLIEHVRQDEGAKPAQPAPIPPHGTPRQGPTTDRRFRRG